MKILSYDYLLAIHYYFTMFISNAVLLDTNLINNTIDFSLLESIFFKMVFFLLGKVTFFFIKIIFFLGIVIIMDITYLILYSLFFQIDFFLILTNFHIHSKNINSCNIKKKNNYI